MNRQDKYRRSRRGFLVKLYHNMNRRVSGGVPHKAYLYEGLELLPRDEFLEWALEHPDYVELHQEWTAAGYPRALTPSIDRIDSRGGYYTLNMQWVTLSENSRRAMILRWHGKVT